MEDIKEWSQVGQQLADKGTPLFCPTCNFKLKGERFCPNCNEKIVYPGENDPKNIETQITNGIKQEKMDESLAGCIGTIGLFGGVTAGIFLHNFWLGMIIFVAAMAFSISIYSQK
ncbi:HTH cro/C1-type domain-containing protein [Latilactobacillus phage TMW 1.1397 P1]|uniref:hypothetical protein n=1 Tax=Latilactobacillus sakei TaxID=1599 RepID=UPI00202EEF5B|nr:hypothetical protein [Latilactobacillus sakei]MCM1597578.1 hypothetical protein [Latilactobacillus sakei]WAX23865.1 HTH cro/C1-type domain-containing protein [Latilactobacillus phage TMW 1.1397 P1]